VIFRPDTLHAIIAGAKTVTRRRLVHRDGRPIRYRPGHTYALQPGRGERHVGHVEVVGVSAEPLGAMTEGDAAREGFDDLEAFQRAWHELHGGYDPEEVVAVIELRLAGRRACCAREGAWRSRS
jgi:hypothetical protein